MPNKFESLVDLLKFPIIVLSVLLGLLATNYWLDFDIGRISKIGPGGLELEKQREVASEATVKLSQSIDEALARIELLEKKFSKETSGITEAEERRVLEEKAQEVTNEVANLYKRATSGGKSLIFGKTGFVWVGDYNHTTGKWSKPKLLRLDGQHEIKAPQDIKEGSKYTLDGNVYLRESFPPDDKTYFRGVRALGVVPRGIEIRIRTRPKPVNREFAVQYWAEVEVLE